LTWSSDNTIKQVLFVSNNRNLTKLVCGLLVALDAADGFGCVISSKLIWTGSVQLIQLHKAGLVLCYRENCKTPLINEEGFIYPPTKTYCSVKHLQVLSFFIFSFVFTCLIDHHTCGSYNKFLYVGKWKQLHLDNFSGS
jgi:hypothetical protein